MGDRTDELALLQRRARQFLVHSFLYYRLGESVISDEAFDALADELRRLRARHPEATLPHADALEPALGPEGSGFLIRTYPPEIVSAAFKLLYAVQAPGVDFHEFVERRGYSAELQPAAR
jgi:DNA ligase-like, N-terminal NAD+-binding domain